MACRLLHKSTSPGRLRCCISRRTLTAGSNDPGGYQPLHVEKKWQEVWRTAEPSSQDSSSQGSKFYMLSMFPYPSGRLHMGHVRVYAISDTMAHFHRMKGCEVLHPMGWDAFGLPAENAAIDRGVHPAVWTKQNITMMRSQLDRMGCHFDWHREVVTCSPDYYRWTQWIFLKLFQRGLAYKKKALVNWDPVDMTVLANEQVDESGFSWRSGVKVEQKYLDQWFFRITDYAESLLQGLDDVDWPVGVKQMQVNWIGKSSGAYVDFNIPGVTQSPLRVFTTKPYTVFGVSFLAISPQHPLVQEVSERLKTEVAQLQSKVSSGNSKNGLFLGMYALHPLTGDQLPVFVADYVISDYGTQAVMGVPAHDERDLLFATEHALSVKNVMGMTDHGDPILINSKQFSGLSLEEGRTAVVEHTRALGVGGHVTKYKLRDWLISRQRYWGAPIPIIYCDRCGVVPVDQESFPVVLPNDVKLTGRGLSPLATEEAWINTTCGRCGCEARRERDTMDTFVDSSWYFLRFPCAGESQRPFTEEANHWMPVDLYVGGIEHAVLHLLYARFITHVLHDLGHVACREPFQKLLTQGMVQAETYKEKASGRYLRPDEISNTEAVDVTWEKMSKSKYNGVDPEDILEEYGADTVRLFMLFKAPPEADIQWDIRAIQGVHKWLHRVWRLAEKHIATCRHTHSRPQELRNQKLVSATHRAIKQVTVFLGERHTFNTAVSELMILSNVLRDLEATESQSREYHEGLSTLIVLLAPMAPHFSSELWERLASTRTAFSGQQQTKEGNVLEQPWPECKEGLLEPEGSKQVVIQVNGRKRGVMSVPSEVTHREKHTQLRSAALEYAIENGLLKSCDNHSISHEAMVVAPRGSLVNIVTRR